MQSKKCRHHIDRIALAKFARNLQHQAFRFQIESISGFDFNRRHALTHQRVQAWLALLNECHFCRSSRGAHRGENAATSIGDSFVAGTLQAHFKFLRAVSGEYEMRVAIDQTRRQQCPRAIMHNRRICQRRISRLAYPGNSIVLRRDGALFN